MMSVPKATFALLTANAAVDLNSNNRPCILYCWKLDAIADNQGKVEEIPGFKMNDCTEKAIEDVTSPRYSACLILIDLLPREKSGTALFEIIELPETT